MPELASEQEAINLANQLFKPKSGKMNKTAIDDYARIAWFLRRDGEFPKALDDVSVFLWQQYCEYFNKSQGTMRNIFTSALRQLAMDCGWKFDTKDHVVLTGGISGELYEQWTREGVLFKDQMDLKHGEHSHTFQWLAICMRRVWMGLQNHPTVLYKSIFDAMRQNNQTLVIPGFKNDSGVQGASNKFSCWSWAVDCFPTSMATGNAIPNEPSLFSNSFRTPQVIMEHILNTQPEDNFVRTYLQFRYKRRSWFKQGEEKYSGVSGASAKVFGVMKHKDVRDWKQVEAEGFKRDAPVQTFRKAEFGDKNDKQKVTAVFDDQGNKKKYVQVKLHSATGYLTDPASLYQ